MTVNDIRELSISEILGRDTVAPDQTLMKRDIAGKTVVVTGAASGADAPDMSCCVLTARW